jgi:hypothetical protein
MQTQGLDACTRFSIELALTQDQGDPALLRKQDADARRLGMSGAEVDAARKGRSFDLRRSRAIALALARENRDDLRLRARQAGLDELACREIEMLAASFSPAAASPAAAPQGE